MASQHVVAHVFLCEGRVVDCVHDDVDGNGFVVLQIQAVWGSQAMMISKNHAWRSVSDCPTVNKQPKKVTEVTPKL